MGFWRNERRGRGHPHHPDGWIFGPKRSIRRDVSEALAEHRPPVLGKVLVAVAAVAVVAMSTVSPSSPVALTSSEGSGGAGDVDAGVPEGVELTPSGSLLVTTDGAVVEGKDVTGRIWVRADDVTIRNSRVSYDSYHSIRLYDGYTGLVVEHVDIECGSHSRTKGIVFGNYTARAVEADGCATAFVSTAGNVEVSGSVVDGEPVDFTTPPRGEPPVTTTTPSGTTPTTDPSGSAPPTTRPPGSSVPPTPPTTRPPGSGSGPGAGFPDASTTGVPAGSALRPSGSVTVTDDGAVLENLHITGTVRVNASDVTIRNSLIDNTGRYPIQIGAGARNLLVEDSTIDGNGQASVAILAGEYTLRRVDVFAVQDGPRIGGDNVVIEDSWIHHLHRVPGGHHDAIQVHPRGTNIVIRHNRIEAYNPDTGDPMNAAIQIGSLSAGPMIGLVVEDNYMNGGNYTVNSVKSSNHPSRYRRNHFGRDFRYGVLSSGPGVQWEGTNVFHDTGEPAR